MLVKPFCRSSSKKSSMASFMWLAPRLPQKDTTMGFPSSKASSRRASSGVFSKKSPRTGVPVTMMRSGCR